MNIHKNARLTPIGRAHLVQQIKVIGLAPAAAAAGISTRTARKWLRRFETEGPAGLVDRSCRPTRSPANCCAHKRQRVIGLRRNLRLTYAVIAERVGLSLSTVARICAGAGVSRLPPLQQRPPVRRYERARAGELLDLDMKKLARFDRPSHRVTGDRGKELSDHARFTVESGVPVFFADPRSLWQRGTNENTNGLLRQYFPKGTDLSRWSAQELQAVAFTLNCRPRKTLGWKTPAETLDEYLKSIHQSGVASTG